MNKPTAQHAAELIAQEQFLKAEQLLTELLELEPESVRAIALMADARYGLKGPQQALSYLVLKAGEWPKQPELMERVAYYQAISGDLKSARDTYSRYLEACPDDARNWIALCDVQFELHAYQDAAQACAKAIENDPEFEDGYLRLGQILQQFKSYPQAINVYQQGLLRLPGNARLQGDMASAYKDSGQTDKAETAFAQALVLDPDNPITHYNLGTLKSETGDLAGARAYLNDAIRLDPKFTHALQQLAQLQPDPESVPDLMSRLESLSHDSNLSDDGRARALFALARLHDEAGHYRKAFKSCSRANALRASARPFDSSRFALDIKRHQRVFSASLMRRFPAMAETQPRVIVIAGAPRSGTTLIDQMISGHPDVESLGENDYMTGVKSDCLRRFQGRLGYPDCLQNCSPIDLMELREIWLKQARSAAPGARFVVDKTLTNYLNVGLFKLLFPDCVVVPSQRQWEDVRLSMFFADFQEGHEYAFTTKGLETFHQHFESLMQHWETLPDLISVPVEYEQLVSAPEAALEPVFQRLGLKAHSNLRAFHDRANRVRTLSQVQVRRPLSKASVGRHQHYDAYWK